MGSSGKARTTFAKLNRESKLRDKRAEKEARKVARKLDAANGTGDVGYYPGEGFESADPEGILDGPEEGSSEGSEEQSEGSDEHESGSAVPEPRVS